MRRVDDPIDFAVLVLAVREVRSRGTKHFAGLRAAPRRLHISAKGRSERGTCGGRRGGGPGEVSGHNKRRGGQAFPAGLGVSVGAKHLGGDGCGWPGEVSGQGKGGVSVGAEHRRGDGVGGQGRSVAQQGEGGGMIFFS